MGPCLSLSPFFLYVLLVIDKYPLCTNLTLLHGILYFATRFTTFWDIGGLLGAYAVWFLREYATIMIDDYGWVAAFDSHLVSFFFTSVVFELPF